MPSRRAAAAGPGRVLHNWRTVLRLPAMRTVSLLSRSRSAGSLRSRRFSSGFGDPIVRLTSAPMDKPAPDSLVFGRTMSDHIFRCDWTAEGGWEAASIQPHEPIEISPSCLGLVIFIHVFALAAAGPHLVSFSLTLSWLVD